MLIRFFIYKALSLNKVLLNISNLSVIKGFSLLNSETPPTIHITRVLRKR
jgi:hypothetical protein